MDLHKLNIWQPYRDFFLEKEITQPFLQLFRELYLKTAEEQTQLHCLRYSDYRSLPPEAIETLKACRWTDNGEEGLQKIYYKENIVANIHPHTGGIAFYERKTYKPLPLKDVPDILFSEVIRDIDRAAGTAR
jgi:hypothetical protein